MKSLPWLATLTLAVVGCTTDPCADVVDRIARASDGDAIVIDGCHLTSPLVVPAGVSVRAVNGASIDVDDEVAVELRTGTGTTSLAGLLVESAGAAGVAVRGSGTAELSDVVVHAHAGIAVGSDGATLTITNGEMDGEVTAETRDDSRWLRVIGRAPNASACPSEPCDCAPGTVEGTRACDATGRWATITATHGVYARGGHVTIDGTRIRGFALFGIELRDVTATIDDAQVDATLGVGIEAVGGTLTTTDLRITNVWTGLRGDPSYAALFAGGAAITTDALEVRDVDGYGLVHASSTGTHRTLTIANAGDVGVWSGGSDTIEILGGSIEGGTFVSVLAVDVASVHLSDVTVDGTRAARRVVGVNGAIDVGDGVQLVGSRPRFERVTITGAERAGLVAELEAPVAGAFTDVSVSSEGTGLGAIAGALDRANGTVSPDAALGWDVGITRAGAAITNDPAFASALDAVLAAEPPSAASLYGAIGPMY